MAGCLVVCLSVWLAVHLSLDINLTLKTCNKYMLEDARCREKKKKKSLGKTRTASSWLNRECVTTKTKRSKIDSQISEIAYTSGS